MGKRAPADRDPVPLPRSGRAEHTNGKVRMNRSWPTRRSDDGGGGMPKPSLCREAACVLLDPWDRRTCDNGTPGIGGEPEESRSNRPFNPQDRLTPPHPGTVRLVLGRSDGDGGG